MAAPAAPDEAALAWLVSVGEWCDVRLPGPVGLPESQRPRPRVLRHPVAFVDELRRLGYLVRDPRTDEREAEADLLRGLFQGDDMRIYQRALSHLRREPHVQTYYRHAIEFMYFFNSAKASASTDTVFRDFLVPYLDYFRACIVPGAADTLYGYRGPNRRRAAFDASAALVREIHRFRDGYPGTRALMIASEFLLEWVFGYDRETRSLGQKRV